MEDNDCFLDFAATFTNYTATFLPNWNSISDADLNLLVNTDVLMFDKLSSYTHASQVRNTDYQVLSYCSTPTTIPIIDNKKIPTNLDV